jgi:hypothetical protein
LASLLVASGAASRWRAACRVKVGSMRAILLIGGLVVVAGIVIVIVPSVAVANSGTATLVAVNSTDIKGTAMLTPIQGGQATIVDVEVQRLEPRSVYALSIHAGSCFGPLLTALQPAVTDGTGNGSSSTTLTAQISASWFIVLHNGDSTRNAVLACGQVIVSAVVVPTQPPIINPSNTPIVIPTASPSPVTPTMSPPPVVPTTPGQFPNTGGGPPQP